MNIVLVEVIPNKDVMTMKLVPPLGLGYMAAILEKAGHKVSIIEGVRYGDSLKSALSLIAGFKPQIVGFTATSQARMRAVELIKMVKRATGAFTVAGGAHFHPTAREALESIPELDAVVKAEGEFTLNELASSLEKEAGLENIEGVFFRSASGEIIETPDRKVIMDLDSLPLPAYHLFDLKEYSCTLNEGKLAAIGVVSSRGCPNNCIFCANRVLRKTVLRLRNPVKFVDELEFLNKEYGYRAFDFWDDTLTMSRPHIENICKEILRRGLRIEWFARVRVNTVDRGILKLMKDAGCVEVAYGVESGSNRVLNRINKGITAEQSLEAVSLSSQLGLRVSAYFIVSLPGETIDDVKKTASLMERFRAFPGVHNYYCFSIIYPGTELEKIAKEEKALPEGFSWYKDHTFERNRIAGNDVTLPCYENKAMPMELIKSAILQSESALSLLKKAFRRLGRLKNIKQLTDFLLFGIRHVFQRKKAGVCRDE